MNLKSKRAKQWRRAKGITESEVIIGGSQDNSPEAADRVEAAATVSEAFDAFLTAFQAVHNALQPMLREQTSQPEESHEEER